jgi:hypothetical protein
MKSISLSTMVGVLLIASIVASVSAQGYPPEIIIVTTPTISGNSIVGVLALTYPDGSKAVLDPPSMTVRLCDAKGCTTVVVTINADGSYSIPIPTGMTGAIMVYIVAGSMKDSYGNTFPAVDTLIGTVTIPGSSPPSGGNPPASQNSAAKPSHFRVANAAVAVSDSKGAVEVSRSNGAALLVLASLVALGAVIIAPRKAEK